MRSLMGLCGLSGLLLCANAAYAQTPAPPGSGLRVCVDSDAYTSAVAVPDSNLIPETARFSGRSSGTVVVLVSIDEKGKVLGLSVAQTDSAFLNAAALEAARKSTYVPATHGCEPIRGQYRFVARFGSSNQQSYGKAAGTAKSSTKSSARSTEATATSACTPGSAWLKSGRPPSFAGDPLKQPGSATIHVAVDANGAAKSAALVKSDLPQPYADAALQMVKTATFSPKLSDDCKPADDEIDVSIGFHP